MESKKQREAVDMVKVHPMLDVPPRRHNPLGGV